MPKPVPGHAIGNKGRDVGQDSLLVLFLYMVQTSRGPADGADGQRLGSEMRLAPRLACALVLAAAAKDPKAATAARAAAAKEQRRVACVKQSEQGKPAGAAATGAAGAGCGPAIAPTKRGRALPVLLYSFPGAGNTWVRQLLEQVPSLGAARVGVSRGRPTRGA